MKENSIVGIPKLGPVVAIDGPAGTGKSSATRRLADVLGFCHIDTGALYRAVAVMSLEKGVEAGVMARAVHLEFRRIVGKNPVNRIFGNGRDLTELIRTPQVTLEASRVSAFPEVRTALLGLQRKLGCAGRTLLEGRDIGTVVFPDADLKFFLFASADERAKRRLIELEASGVDAPSFEEIRTQILERDLGDSTRDVAPLKKAIDAIELDTSRMTLDEVVKYMESIVKNRLRL